MIASSAPVAVPIGDYRLCGWVYDDTTGDTSGPFTGTFTVTAADTISLQSPADAIEGQTFDVDASGDVYDPNAVIDATYKPTGGSCASTPGTDTGTVSATGLGPSTNGSASYTAAASQLVLDAGGYLVCAWLVDDQTTAVLARASADLSVHTITASLDLRLPVRVDPGEAFSVNASTDLPAGVQTIAVADVVPKRGTTTCAANPDAEPTTAVEWLDAGLTDTQVPSGTVATDETGEAELQDTGRYLVCGWLLNDWSNVENPPTIAGPISATVTVVPLQVFRGRTSQHLALSITVAAVERFVLEISYSDHIRCPRPTHFEDGELWNGDWDSSFSSESFGTVRIGKSGAVRVRLTGNPNHTFELSGRASGDTLAGTFTEKGKALAFTDNPAQTFRCTSGTVRFRVRAA